MNIIPPEKRRNCYVSMLQNKRKKNVTIKLDDVKVVSIADTSDGSGHCLNLWVSRDSEGYKSIDAIESFVTEQVIQHHHTWFKTGVPTSKLTEFFMSCMSPHATINVAVSGIKTPRVMINGQDVDDFSQVATMNTRELKRYHCACVVEVTGVYFYPQKFGIKLLLRSVTLTDDASTQKNAETELLSADKTVVEAEWRDELEEFHVLLSQDHQLISDKLKRIQQLRNEADTMFHDAVVEDSCSSVWNSHLESLGKLIFKYKTGRLL